MLDRIGIVKKQLTKAISQCCEASWMFVKHPKRDFTKKRKLPFNKVISFLLAMEGGTLTTELLKYFGCSPNFASASAFVQQSGKIDASDCFLQAAISHCAFPNCGRCIRDCCYQSGQMQLPSLGIKASL